MQLNLRSFLNLLIFTLSLIYGIIYLKNCLCTLDSMLQHLEQLLMNVQATVYVSWNCGLYEGWNFNSGNYLFTTDTK